MKKTIFALMSAIVFLAQCIICADAAVYTTTEPTNGDCVYIAGNPDMYPIEYYDANDKEFKGILPEIYKKISEESGIDFSYVSAGAENEQSRMARNKQVEIVSAHVRGEVEGVNNEVRIITLDSEGEAVDICICFTSIASQTLIDTVSSAVSASTNEDLARMAIENSSMNTPSDFSFWVFFVTIESFVLIFLLFFNVIKRHNTERKATENMLVDHMTGIGNRLYFDLKYQHLISPASSTLYYIAYIGIDVKQIVQYYDVSVSEDIQMYAASEIIEDLTERDFCARTSDGRFVMAFEAPTVELAEKKLDELLSYLNQFNKEVTVKFQAGLYHMETPGIPCDKAIFNARHGYYRARETGDPFVLCDAKLLEHEEYVLGLKKKLWRGIKQKEFRLYTQYIFTDDGKTACGAEALSRWENPEDGMILPRDYIEMLETAEMIDELDFYILEECCRTLSDWKDDNRKKLWLSCNINGITLSNPGFAKRFKKMIDRYAFELNNLVLEITEDALADTSSQVAENIDQCKAFGCRIALDSFGSGGSYVKNLGDYPIDIIKIDRQLIAASKTEKGERLLTGIIRFAHYLGIEVLCEGVEDDEELENAFNAESDYVQGFLLARTIPVDQASADRDTVYVSM